MNNNTKIICHPELVEGCTKKNNHISIKLNMTVVFFLASIFTLYAQNNNFKPVHDVDKAQAELAKLSENTQSIQSEFIQEKHLSFLSENIISKGAFYFKSPNLLRWEYSEPFEYIIVFNGKNIFINDDGKISTFDTESNKMFSEINNMMIGSIQGDLFTDTERFAVKYFENASQYMLELDPQLPEMKSMLKTIMIYIDKSNISVAKIKMIESSDDYTSIEFINRKLNQDISSERFELK